MGSRRGPGARWRVFHRPRRKRGRDNDETFIVRLLVRSVTPITHRIAVKYPNLALTLNLGTCPIFIDIRAIGDCEC